MWKLRRTRKILHIHLYCLEISIHGRFNFFTFALYIRQQGVMATTATASEEKEHKVPMKNENSPLINFSFLSPPSSATFFPSGIQYNAC